MCNIMYPAFSKSRLSIIAMLVFSLLRHLCVVNADCYNCKGKQDRFQISKSVTDGRTRCCRSKKP
jgi:hypothetical protein